MSPPSTYVTPVKRSKTSIDPSRTTSLQNDCPLFKLAAKTRNQIYELVFAAVETNDDGAIDLAEAASLPSNALTATCQQIYNESHKVFKLAYRHYPAKHTFTLDMPTYDHEPSSTAFSREFFHRLHSFRVTWRLYKPHEHHDGEPLHLTTHFWRPSKPTNRSRGWTARVDVHVHDSAWSPQSGSSRSIFLVNYSSGYWAMTTLNSFYLSNFPWECMEIRSSKAFASAVRESVYYGLKLDSDT